MTNTIEKYNNELIREQRNINIIDYINEVNKLFYKIDTSFINEFIDLISRNECCIHHNLLEKYEVISLSSSTFDIKRILDQNELIIEKDYFKLIIKTVFRESAGLRLTPGPYQLVITTK
jgi:hypothetical protein